MSRRTIALTILSESVGGAEAVVRQIAQHLDQARYDCLIVTNEEIRGYYEDAGLTTLSLGSFHRWPGFTVLNRVGRKIEARWPTLALARLREKIGRLAELVRDYRIELLHSHLLADSYLVSQLAPGSVKKVMTIHGGLGLDIKMSYWLDTNGVLATLNQADFVTSACRYFLDLVRAHGVDLRGRSAIIENGIDTEALAEAEPPGGRGYEGVLRMVFLGGDRYLKGGDLLVQALGLVVNENRRTDVHLTVLRNVHRTSDMYRRLRTDRLLEHVDLVGYVPNKGHLDYIEAGDLFVLPSRSEGIANTLMEAIGLGKAILATDVGGTSEVVAHGTNGYLCRPSPESIAEGILYFLENSAKLGEFGQRNRELRSRFLWPGIVAKYESLYERLLTD